ncbi:dual specificity protein phosphatase 1-like [Coffea eugenioides]|uniref:dual specificity protein phosphatase 1-like n=1 Tax=Coffea eugenioides TaxID=49369 RepID=UPI000F614450|nr:dual specificity protein phosphatase 1-like [Coffea eugenioides]
MAKELRLGHQQEKDELVVALKQGSAAGERVGEGDGSGRRASALNWFRKQLRKERKIKFWVKGCYQKQQYHLCDMPYLVRENLFIGNTGAAADFLQHGTEDDSGDGSKSSLAPEKVLYYLEKAGKDLKFARMAVPLRDTESEDLLDYLDVCLDFIDRSRQEGSVLVHCFAGVSRS